jgi:hypothetical protein
MMDALKHLFARIAAASKDGGLWWGVGISVGLAVVSLAIALAVIVGWSAHRFGPGAPTAVGPPRALAGRALGRIGKNLAGAILMLLGLAMALPGVPGQGVLTMIIGLTLLDFPGKRELERRLVRRPAVLRRLNDLRRRFHRPPLELD